MPEERGDMGVLWRESTQACFILRVVVFFFPKGRILGDVSGEDSNRIFISVPGVCFNMLIHQNKRREGSGSFFGQFHLQRLSLKRDQD